MTATRYGRAADLKGDYDLTVVGAGPAGLAAAATASALGLDVLVCDENPSPGGQIYRGIGEAPKSLKARLGKDYAAGERIVARFLESSVDYAPKAVVWSVAPDEPETGDAVGLEVGVSLGGAARLLRSRRVILATGALERPFAVPGWTLPGVMTAGSAQIALKTAGLVPDGRVVIAGTGPLLYLLATQLMRAGATVAAIVDTTPRENPRRAWRHGFEFACSSYGLKGLGLLAQAHRRARVIRHATALEAAGRERLEAVVVAHPGGVEHLPADLLLLHQGVAPNLNLALAAGCAYGWDHAQALFKPLVDDWGESSVPDVAIAGDSGGIVGAAAAGCQGEIAGLAAAWRLGRLPGAERDARVAPVRARLAAALRGRAFIDALFRPAEAFRVPARADTIVCRCEEVTAGSIRETLPLGVLGPNQLKAFLRCGMGPCQGRLCGLTVAELIAQERRVSPGEVGYYRLRPPIKPVALRELAALPKTDAAIMAVVGFVERPASAGHE